MWQPAGPQAPTPNAAIGTFTDDFTALGPQWTAVGSTPPSVVAGQVHLPCIATYTSITAAGYRYSMVGSSCQVEAPQVPQVGAGTAQCYFMLRSSVNPKTCVQIGTLNGVLNAEKVTGGGAPINVGNVVYNATNHRWWRIREAAGQIIFEAGADGTTFGVTVATVATSTITGFDPEQVVVELGAGYFGAETTPQDAIFDNLNLLPGGTTYTKAGTAAGAAAGSGADLVEHSKTGTGAAAGAPGGAKAVEHPKTGTGAGAAAASGAKLVSVVVTKAGTAAAAGAATGPKLLEHRKTGTGAGAAAAAGARVAEHTKAGTGAARGAPSGTETCTRPRTGTAAATAAASGAKTVEHPKAGTAAAAGAPGGPVLILSGDLYAGSATSLSGPWLSTGLAVGPGTGDNATYAAAAGSSGVLELAAFGASAAVPAGSDVRQVQITVRHSVDDPASLSALTAQAYVGTTAVGSPQPLVASATPHEDTITVTGVAWSDLSDLRVRITAARS